MKKLIVDTNKYAGNFEKEISRLFNYADVQLYIHPTNCNNGLGFNFDANNIEECKEAQRRHIAYRIKEDLSYRQKNVDVYSQSWLNCPDQLRDAMEDRDEIQKEIDDYASNDPQAIPRYGAYNSVAITLRENHNIEDMKKELREWVKLYNAKESGRYKEYRNYVYKNLEITGFRIIVEKEKYDGDSVLKGGQEIKVRVTEYKGNIIIETVDPEEKDNDYRSCGNGRIGCSLENLNRLGMSEEAYDILKQRHRSGGDLGDINWDKTSFTWIGGPVAIKEEGFYVDNEYTPNRLFHVIPNEPSQYIVDEYDRSKANPRKIEYKDVKYEFTINIISEEKGRHKFSVDGKVWKEAFFYDGEIILNAPEGKVKHDEYTTVKYNGVDMIDVGLDSYWNTIKISRKKARQLINYLYSLGFFNNLLKAEKHHWRMMRRSTAEEIIELTEKIKEVIK